VLSCFLFILRLIIGSVILGLLALAVILYLPRKNQFVATIPEVHEVPKQFNVNHLYTRTTQGLLQLRLNYGATKMIHVNNSHPQLPDRYTPVAGVPLLTSVCLFLFNSMNSPPNVDATH
jgi:hypothetical protein